MSTASIAAIRPDDVSDVLLFWRRIEGMGLDDVQESGALSRYIERNPGCSFLARDGSGRVIGAVMGGHDGRRGYVHHLAVDLKHRREGLGRRLLEHTLSALREAGLAKCHLFVFADNEGARAFYERSQWSLRTDLVVMTRTLN